MFKFNSDEIWVNYIKQMLFSFNLPKCRIFNSEEEVKSFFPIDIDVFVIIKKYKSTRDCIVRYNNGKFTFVSYYFEGKYYQNITTKFNLYNNTYDTNTHKYLGEYLRYLRDCKNLNLMSMYNCYADDLLTDTQYKYILIPIKYNTTYSIALSEFNYSYVMTTQSTLSDIQKLFLDDSKDKVNIKYSSFSKTYQINSPTNGYTILNATKIYDIFNEKNLKLVLRLPLSNTSNIVVLEGTYSYIKETSIIQANYEDDKSINYEKVDLNNIIKGRLQLLEINYFDNTIKPFADKLFEYLFDNVILPKDKISKNIINAKYKLGTYGSDYEKIRSTYKNIDRLKFLEVLKNEKYKNKNSYDLLGYIDKDIEYFIDDKYNGGK